MKKTNRREFIKQVGLISGAVLISKPVLDLKKDRKKEAIHSVTIRGLKLIDEHGNTFEETPFEKSYTLLEGDQIQIKIHLTAESIFDLKKF